MNLLIYLMVISQHATISLPLYNPVHWFSWSSIRSLFLCFIMVCTELFNFIHISNQINAFALVPSCWLADPNITLWKIIHQAVVHIWQRTWNLATCILYAWYHIRKLLKWNFFYRFLFSLHCLSKFVIFAESTTYKTEKRSWNNSKIFMALFAYTEFL